ncbi:MAG: GNAT family N-acetyltransferase [Minisyncoccia bacterium]
MILAEVFNSNQSSWNETKDSIISLENEAFEQHPFTEDELEKDFINSENTIVLLKNLDNQEIIGFAYAKPMEPETSGSPALPGETAWMWDTVIKKDYRGKGLLGVIMDKLENELKIRGFKYLERNALIANDFAENISRHYKERIIKSFPLESKWGPQVFFRIEL